MSHWWIEEADCQNRHIFNLDVFHTDPPYDLNQINPFNTSVKMPTSLITPQQTATNSILKKHATKKKEEKPKSINHNY